MIRAAVLVGAGLVFSLPTASQQLPALNLVLITVDTLRADRVGSYGYAKARTPAMDGLAARGTRFDQAFTHSPLTLPAHISIMTGRYPSEHGARDNGSFVLGDRAITLAEQLHEAGFRTGAFVGSFLLDSGYGLDQGFDHYDDEFRSMGSLLDYDVQRPAAAVAERTAAWIRKVAPDRFFVWAHFYDPHTPYTPPPAFRGVATPYDGEVAAADLGISTILVALDRAGVADHTAVIVTADHGEGLGDHGEREHGLLLYDSVLRVPLIIAFPGGTSRVVRTPVRHIDLMPTVLALAGARLQATLPGRNLARVLREGDATTAGDADVMSYAETWYGRLHFGWSEMRSVRTAGWKYIEAPRPELYDVQRDPGERVNRVGHEARLADRLAAEAARVAASGTHAIAIPRGADSETLARLRSLGYVGGGGGRQPAHGSGRRDPKDMLAAFERYVRMLNSGIAALQAGRLDTAVNSFRSLVAEYPESFEALHYLGYAYDAAGRHREAVAEYDRALVIQPAYAVAHFNAAKALAALGEAASARARLARGLALEPRSFYGHMVAGVVAWQLSDGEGAVAAFRRAVELNPGEARARANLAEAYMRLSDYSRARPEYEALVRLGYRPAAAHFNLGVIAQALGDKAGARLAFQRALAIDPTLEAARRALATLQ